MKTNLLLCLALVLSGGLFGCSTPKQSAFLGGVYDIEQVKLPIKFSNYHELYAFIAKYNTYGGMQTDANTLFKLAADSTTEIITLEKLEDTNLPPYVYIVTSHYYNGGIFDEIRGAQGNGNFYILRPLAKDFTSMDTDHGFELVGLVAGNAYRWREVARHLILQTHWHSGAFYDDWTSYKWNGNYFEQIP